MAEGEETFDVLYITDVLGGIERNGFCQPGSGLAAGAGIVA